jgi:hypothetical protein
VFDPLGEGANVVHPEEPIFGSQPAPKAGASPSAKHTPNRRKIIGHLTRFTLDISRPFSRDCCTVILTHGDPTGFNMMRRRRWQDSDARYVLLGSTSHYLIQTSSVPVMAARHHLHCAVDQLVAMPILPSTSLSGKQSKLTTAPNHPTSS